MEKSIDDTLRYYEELLNNRPNDENIRYWVAFYYEKSIEKRIDIENRSISLSEITEIKKRYEFALSGGYSDASNDLKRIAKSKMLSATDLKEGRIRKGKVVYFLFGVVLIIIMLLFWKMELVGFEEKPKHVIKNEQISGTDKLTAAPEANGIQMEKENVSVIDKKVIEKFKQRDSVELVVLKSALFQFVINEGRFPATLEELTADFPKNYISSIPKSAYRISNIVKEEYDNTGGWVYKNPERINLNLLEAEEIKEMVNKAVAANFIHECDKTCDFEPVGIEINKEGFSLKVVAGEIVLKEYKVGLGRDNRTPEGVFYVSKKVVSPNAQIGSKAYGTRALELSGLNYAIHGTYKEESIGRLMSLGCVRLTNVNVEEVYALVPLGSEVKIGGSENSTISVAKDAKEELSVKISPYFVDEDSGIGDGEMDSEKIYEWLN